MLAKVLCVLTGVSLVVVALITTSTLPSGIGPFGILILFIAMYIATLGMVTFSVFGFSKLAARTSKMIWASRPIETLALKESYYYGTIIALGPVMLIGMQSVGGIGIYEFGLVLVFTVLGCVYVARKTS